MPKPEAAVSFDNAETRNLHAVAHKTHNALNLFHQGIFYGFIRSE